jgi:superfamily II DNA or RNA helicase
MQIILKHKLNLYGLPADFKQRLMNTFTLSNPRWIENNKMGRWNHGVPRSLKYYRMLPKSGLQIPRGYTGQLLRFCRQHQISYQMEDQRCLLKPIEVEFLGQLRPFQKQAVEKMLAKEFGSLNAPTGSGKTFMALYMIAARQQPALIIVHTRELARQWRQRIAEYLGIPIKEIGLIGSGKRQIGPKITVALIQSLYKCIPEVARRIGFLIVDECHHIPSRTFSKAVGKFSAHYMLGLSATPWRRDGLSKLIFWFLGDIHFEITKKDLVQSGNLMTAHVIVRETDFEPYHDPVNEYSQTIAELVANEARNQLIASDVANEAQRPESICLVLSDRKSHCKTLQTMIRKQYDVHPWLLTGDLSHVERNEVLHQLQEGNIKVLIATGQLIGEGFDCQHLTTLFLVTPIKFSGRLLQYLGRVIRPAPNKKQARVYDYVDAKVDILRNAANARQRVYHSE